MTLRTTQALNSSEKESRQLALIQALQRAEKQAIQTIAAKITPDIKILLTKAQLPKEDLQEIVQDAILVLINSIRKGKFEHQGYHPGAYSMGVAKKLIANKIRSKKAANLELKEGVLISDFDTEKYIQDKERQSIIDKLLQKLGSTCYQLIHLKYFEQRKDKEIIEQKLTDFSSTDSLKSKRSQCMKKLSALAQKAGLRAFFKN